MRKLIFVAALALLPVVALADPVPLMPAYDVAAYCQSHTTPALNEGQCIDKEYNWRGDAAKNWPQISPAARAECVAVNKWHSYETLRLCIDSHKFDVPAASRAADGTVIKVPCRDMGDGRILIAGSYLPDGFPDGLPDGRPAYKIIHTEKASMQGEWANLVCTIRLTR